MNSIKLSSLVLAAAFATAGVAHAQQTSTPASPATTTASGPMSGAAPSDKDPSAMHSGKKGKHGMKDGSDKSGAPAMDDAASTAKKPAKPGTQSGAMTN